MKPAFLIALLLLLTNVFHLQAATSTSTPAANVSTIDRLHLMSDRQDYQPGDRIWLSVFVFDAESRQISSPSEYVHVDLMDCDLEVCKRILLKKEDNGFSGYLDIPADFKPGRSILRAYTQQTAGYEEMESVVRLGIGQEYHSSAILSYLYDYQPSLSLRPRQDSMLVSVVMPDEVVGQDVTFAISITTDSVDVRQSIVNSVQRPLPVQDLELVEPEQSQSIRGYVTNLMGDRVYSKVLVSLMAPLEGFTSVAVSDTMGRFSFDNLEFADDVTLFIQATDHLGEGSYRVNLRDPIQIPCPYLTGKGYELELEDEWLMDFDGKRLDEVIVRSKKRVTELMKYSRVVGIADRVYTEKYIRDREFLDIFSLIRSCAGVRVDASNNIYLRGRTIGGGSEPAWIIVDGIKIDYNPTEYLQSIRIEEVVQVDIYKSAGAALVVGGGGRGAVSITTRAGVKRDEGNYSPNIVKQKTQGHQVALPFQRSAKAPNTLYWNPYVRSRGVHRLTFLVPKADHSYVHLEGLTADGKTLFLNQKAY